MSIIDTAGHSIVSYVAGKTKAFSGQRLSVVSWKTKDGIKPESKCVSLPMIQNEEITDNLMLLLPHIKAMMETAQDKILREVLEKNYKEVSLRADQIGIAAIVEFLDDSNESGRVTKEAVEVWFSETIADSLTVALAQKLGVSDTPSEADSAKILAIVAAFKRDISALAGGKTAYNAKVAGQLIKALEFAPESDAMAQKFMIRLDGMVKKVAEYEDAL